jgi:hypothetical protein
MGGCDVQLSVFAASTDFNVCTSCTRRHFGLIARLEAAMERPIAAFAAFTGLTAALLFALKRRQAVSMSSAKLVAVFLIGSL